MDEHTRQSLVFHGAATTILVARLVAELDERGVLSKTDFAAKLNAMAESAAKSRNPKIPHPWDDLTLIRRVAAMLVDPTPSDAWTPTVIDGGKE
jgi:hypothetical protein